MLIKFQRSVTFFKPVSAGITTIVVRIMDRMDPSLIHSVHNSDRHHGIGTMLKFNGGNDGHGQKKRYV